MRLRAAVALARDRSISEGISAWFNESARALPWRVSPRDPYLSLVSEFMLQQTQVSRVLEKWGPFVSRFPTLKSLATAREDEVLALWSGMGYYRRARNLHAAARKIWAEYGAVPSEVDRLMDLPGVGRYTAGAIASIAFDQPVPIVDGNVARVLMRIEGEDFAHGAADGVSWAWDRAEKLVAGATGVSVAALNEGLMELGATVCTPGMPDCKRCPVSQCCVARQKSAQDRIPRPKAPTSRAVVHCASIIVRDARDRLLVERRGDDGMWAGMWQAPTLERADRASRQAELAAWIGAAGLRRLGKFTHQTTHREVRFAVWVAEKVGAVRGGRLFKTERQVAKLAISNPQRRILLGESAAVSVS